jgi:ELWxxDGT repeat protein
MKKALLFTIALSLHQLALQAQPIVSLVKDIAPGVTNGNPGEQVVVNGRIYFAASDGTDTELWGSDGSEAGTRLVKDIYPGAGAGAPANLTAFNGKLYFTANDGSHGHELWVSDGTEGGTVMVKDINPTINGSEPTELTVVDNKLYFSADDGTHGRELWMSDGTEVGTILLRDISTSSTSAPTQLTAAMGKLFFVQDFNTGKALFVSDGTGGGTVAIQEEVAPQWLKEYNGKLYFSAYTATHGRELWSSDGTLLGTQLLKDIDNGAASSTPGALHVAGGKLFFTAQTVADGRELWVSDGTESGTSMVLNANPSNLSAPITDEMAEYNGKLYYSFVDETGTDRLWMSDGTAGGTQRVHADVSRPKQLFVFEGKLYFTGYSTGSHSTYGSQLWRSDGSAQGTTMQLPDANTPADAVGTTKFVTLGNDLYYTAAYQFATGKELWKINAFPAAVAGVEKSAPHIYPNPAQGALHIKLPVVKDASVKIYSLTGQLILQQVITAKNMSIDVSMLSPGMYLTHITTDGQTAVEKLVKQ